MWSALLAAAIVLTGCAAGARPAHAQRGVVSIIQDDRLMYLNPVATVARLRQLGADQVRIALRWQQVAPAGASFRRPRNFNAANPAAYPAIGWAPYDAMVRAAAAGGLAVNFNIVGGAPLWATGPGMPHQRGYPFHNWRPSAREFGAFVRAAGTRYSGNFNPATGRVQRGNANDLPRVDFWSIYNEPDYGPSLAPQALPGHPGVEYSPRMYRDLVDQAWGALRATGHSTRTDTILIGELAPRSVGTTFGNFNGMLPLVFLRAMYCVDAGYRPLRGTAAALRGCPTTRAGSRRFAAQHPALFQASGYSDHPYMRWYPPDQEENQAPVYPAREWAYMKSQFTTLGTIGNLERALGRLVAVYGSHTRFPIWNTEYGYITSPPKRRWAKDRYPWVSPATAAAYDNEAEYLSWKDPRLMSFEQYLLQDAIVPTRRNDYGGFASGLLTYTGAQKAGYSAWRMPLYLPRTVADSATQRLEVWGAVKPIHYVALDSPASTQSVDVLFAPQGTGQYSVIDTVPITDTLHGYFDTHIAFPQSGTVVLEWKYPPYAPLGAAPGYAIYSRHVHVTVH
jgi:hypothetical protein